MSNEQDKDNLPEPVADIREELKRQHDRESMRPPNRALDKHGPQLEEDIDRELRRQRQAEKATAEKLPRRDGPDMDKE